MKRIFAIVTAIGLIALPALGQFSHYSMYGFGIASPVQPVRSLGLGLTGAALPDSISLNSVNPALWTNFVSTSLQGQMYFSNIAVPNLDYTTNFGRFVGFAFKFPIGKKIGIGLGLNPVTRMDANRTFIDTLLFDGIKISSQSDLLLTGGISEFFLGGGFRLSPYLNLGAKARFLLGNYVVNYNTTLSGTNKVYSYWQMNSVVKGTSLEVGSLWNVPRTHLTMAFTFDKNLKFSYQKSIDYSYGPDTTAPSRPLAYPGTLRLALTNKFSNFLRLNLEWHYTYTDHSVFQDFYLFTPVKWQNAQYIGVGIELTPVIDEKHPEISRFAYRFGLYYRTEPVYWAGTQISERGLTAGIGLPIFNDLNRIDFALTYGLRKGFLSNEKFFTLSCGLTTGELWFLKYKRR